MIQRTFVLPKLKEISQIFIFSTLIQNFIEFTQKGGQQKFLKVATSGHVSLLLINYKQQINESLHYYR